MHISRITVLKQGALPFVFVLSIWLLPTSRFGTNANNSHMFCCHCHNHTEEAQARTVSAELAVVMEGSGYAGIRKN